MTYTVTYTSYWKPSLTPADTQHLESLGFAGSCIKGNPYTSHLKKPGDPTALCGKEPGGPGRTRKMVDRRGWVVYKTFEGPGRKPCEACLRAAELLSNVEVAGLSREDR